MKRKRVRLGLALLLILLTIAVFARYISEHQNLLQVLKHTPPMTLLWLFLLYAAWLGALGLILQTTLIICRRKIPTEENILLNAYSTLINFFVPGQGGIAARGLYLKQRHKLSMRNYVIAMLFYYACYALLSTLLLLVTNRPWWQTVGGVVLAGFGAYVVMRWYMGRSHTKADGLDIQPKTLLYFGVATTVQAIVQVAIYAVELHSVNHAITLGQAITYTGAANFALFVALTPGAIGVRESFLVFSRGLHHISTANIVAASVIDRGVFLVFLGLLFLLTLSLHAKNKFRIGPSATKGDEDPGSIKVIEQER